MRGAWVDDDTALRERLSRPGQDPADSPRPDLPPYVLSFLAHLRLLVGVPFNHLVPDPAMLPAEAIRFFHLDRSWTDRLVDGALAVGKAGTREQAHHQAAAADVDAALHAAEPLVRAVQRGLASIDDPPPPGWPDEAPPVTGVLLRSALVSGWPHLELVAYRASVRLPLLRLERLAPAVLLALWAGVPDRVHLEEPHHGVQFGATTTGGALGVVLRHPDGTAFGDAEEPAGDLPGGPAFPFGFRDDALRLVDVTALRRLLSYEADQRQPPGVVPGDPATGSPDRWTGLPVQTGSAALATELLQPPYRQVFTDTPGGDQP